MVQSRLLSARKSYSIVIIQKYKMNWGEADTWKDKQIKAWEHNEYLLMQELGNAYYKL